MKKLTNVSLITLAIIFWSIDIQAMITVTEIKKNWVPKIPATAEARRELETMHVEKAIDEVFNELGLKAPLKQLLHSFYLKMHDSLEEASSSLFKYHPAAFSFIRFKKYLPLFLTTYIFHRSLKTFEENLAQAQYGIMMGSPLATLSQATCLSDYCSEFSTLLRIVAFDFDEIFPNKPNQEAKLIWQACLNEIYTGNFALLDFINFDSNRINRLLLSLRHTVEEKSSAVWMLMIFDITHKIDHESSFIELTKSFTENVAQINEHLLRMERLDHEKALRAWEINITLLSSDLPRDDIADSDEWKLFIARLNAMVEGGNFKVVFDELVQFNKLENVDQYINHLLLVDVPEVVELCMNHGMISVETKDAN